MEPEQLGNHLVDADAHLRQARGLPRAADGAAPEESPGSFIRILLVTAETSSAKARQRMQRLICVAARR
jgi:hypothetical protein